VCKQQKDKDLFGKNKNKLDGLSDECKICKKELDKKYYLANKEKIKQRTSTWYFNNKEHANSKMKEYGKKWRVENKDKNCSKSTKYRASKLKATPLWVDEEHKWLIDEVYHLAKIRSESTGIVWHVDHIVPLKGKTVCGLHVIENLQILPATENISKGNKFVCL
jgi:hypothetical protein